MNKCYVCACLHLWVHLKQNVVASLTSCSIYIVWNTSSCRFSQMYFLCLIEFFLLTGMKNAMNTTLQISSISCIQQRGRAFLTVESMCWDTFSRYRVTMWDSSTLAKHRSVCIHAYIYIYIYNMLVCVLSMCSCFREGHLLPSIEISAPSWE